MKETKMPCSHIKTCPLFSIFNLKASLNFWKNNFCETEDQYQTCARYEKTTRGEQIPITLLPNGEDLSKQIPKR